MVYIVKQLVLYAVSFVSIRFKLKQMVVYDSSLQEYNKIRCVAVFNFFILKIGRTPPSGFLLHCCRIRIILILKVFEKFVIFCMKKSKCLKKYKISHAPF